jgi:hypothetical protein
MQFLLTAKPVASQHLLGVAGVVCWLVGVVDLADLGVQDPQVVLVE